MSDRTTNLERLTQQQEAERKAEVKAVAETTRDTLILHRIIDQKRYNSDIIDAIISNPNVTVDVLTHCADIIRQNVRKYNEVEVEDGPEEMEEDLIMQYFNQVGAILRHQNASPETVESATVALKELHNADIYSIDINYISLITAVLEKSDITPKTLEYIADTLSDIIYARCLLREDEDLFRDLSRECLSLLMTVVGKPNISEKGLATCVNAFKIIAKANPDLDPPCREQIEAIGRAKPNLYPLCCEQIEDINRPNLATLFFEQTEEDDIVETRTDLSTPHSEQATDINRRLREQSSALESSAQALNPSTKRRRM